MDVWAIGCIFAEMLRRKPIFQGKDPSHQLYIIIKTLGSPSEEEMAFIQHPAAKAAIVRHGFFPKRSLQSLFPDTNPDALDLLEKMLVFSPNDRIDIDQALDHPYLAQLHNPVGILNVLDRYFE